MIEEKLETEHKEWFCGKDKVYGCIYEKTYDRGYVVFKLQYCWRKD